MMHLISKYSSLEPPVGSVVPGDDGNDGLSVGVIIGIVAAILAFIFLILVICIICITWRRNRYRERKERIIDSIYADNRRYYCILCCLSQKILQVEKYERLAVRLQMRCDICSV